MSYEESKERRLISFRTSLDIGMGVFYIAIGAIVIYARAFGTMEITPVIAYLLGGLMVIGGIARFYRGIKTILKKNNSNLSANE